MLVNQSNVFSLEVGGGGGQERYRRPCRNALVTYASVASPTVCLKKVTPAVTTSSVVIPVHNWVKAYLKNILSHAEIVVIA